MEAKVTTDLLFDVYESGTDKALNNEPLTEALAMEFVGKLHESKGYQINYTIRSRRAILNG